VFIGLVGIGAAGVLFGAKVQNRIEKLTAAPLAKDVTGLFSLLPFGRFRYYSVTGSFPQRDRRAYSLKVGGLVERPLTLSYAQIVGMPKTKLVRDFRIAIRVVRRRLHREPHPRAGAPL
jgi:DMSO/TMAO reductase YedYZ molybdopterin-dependent catalytic subunit